MPYYERVTTPYSPDLTGLWEKIADSRTDRNLTAHHIPSVLPILSGWRHLLPPPGEREEFWVDSENFARPDAESISRRFIPGIINTAYSDPLAFRDSLIASPAMAAHIAPLHRAQAPAEDFLRRARQAHQGIVDTPPTRERSRFYTGDPTALAQMATHLVRTGTPYLTGNEEESYLAFPGDFPEEIGTHEEGSTSRAMARFTLGPEFNPHWDVHTTLAHLRGMVPEQHLRFSTLYPTRPGGEAAVASPRVDIGRPGGGRPSPGGGTREDPIVLRRGGPIIPPYMASMKH